jgi:hypothetical protein
MINSELFSLNLADIVKGSFLTVISAVLTAVLQMISVSPPEVDVKQIGQVALTTFIAYMINQFNSNSKGVPFQKEL